MSAVGLRLDALSKRYGELAVLKSLSLNLAPGQLLALLGPSGCGKTTTLSIIAGLVQPDAGQVFFGERDVTNLPPEHRNLGLVFQRYALFPHLNVFGNVAFGLQVRGVPKAEQRRRVEEALALVQLSGLEARYPKQLSGGQQQRVALARTLVTEPDLLLLDEPLSNLDANLRTDLRGFIRTLQQRLGLTTVFVTHDQQEALEVADVVGLMFEGGLEQLGSPEAIFERPATTRAARFMGVRTLLPVEATSDGKARTSLGCLRLANPAEVGDVLSLRLERLKLYARREDAPSVNTVLAQVSARRYQGARIHYELRAKDLDSKDLNLSAESVVPDFRVGDEVYVHLPPDHLHVIKRASEGEL